MDGLDTITQNYPSLSDEDLPLWMRQARQSADWGILITFGLCLLLGWAFVLQPGLPESNANLNYAYQTENYVTSFQEGRLYPRWTAPALNGYGAPIPHYYPPGAPYLTALLQVLFTGDTVNAIRVAYLLALCVAGSVTYAFVTRFAGAGAGLLAALLYVYSPYVGITTPHILGDLPGALALAIYPTLLWSAYRLLTIRRAFDFSLLALSFAALILVKPEAVPVAIGFLLGLIIWYALTGRWRYRFGLVALAAIFGALLATFYWFPAATEQTLIHWVEPPYQPLPQQLAPLALLTPLHRIDLNELVHPPQFTLGLGLVVFGIIGCLSVIRLSAQRGLYAIFILYALLLVGIGLFVIPAQTWLLGPISLCVAITGSATLRVRRYLSPTYRRLALPIQMMAVLALAVPVWLSPAWESDEIGLLDAQTQIIRYEQEGYGVAALPPGAMIPSTLQGDIPPNDVLIDNYGNGEVGRMVTNQITSGREVTLITGESHEDRYQISTVEGTIFDLWRAYFEGWQATVNGSEVGLAADPETGLMRLNPGIANGATLRITLESTRVRLAAWIIAWMTLTLLIIGALVRLRRQSSILYNDLKLLSIEEARLLALVALGFLAAILIFARPQSPYTFHAQPGHSLDNTTRLGARTDTEGIQAISYHLDGVNYHLGQNIDLILAWKASIGVELVNNYQVIVFLSDGNSNIRWAEQPIRTPGGYPTGRWAATGNRHIRDPYTIHIPKTLAPGQYYVALELYLCSQDCQPENRARFRDADGAALGTVLRLPTPINITP